ncbi:capsid cement protein [Georgenia sp. M64]|uniref:capsid cement protein n=1 Tax=Georgenia sp. M64 TaxID=3120520 RepID=UPI0030DFE29F
MTQYLPAFAPGAAITYAPTAAVTGGQVVAVSGNRAVAPAGADSAAVVGVAAHDAAVGDQLAVHPLTGVVHELVASGVIAAGDRVATGTAGTVAALGAGSNPIGTALTGALDGETVTVLGR